MSGTADPHQPSEIIPVAGEQASPGPVTVIVPVRNEAASITALLDALWGQTLPPQQVIVVDAGSSDGTREILRDRVQADGRLKVIEVERAYPGEGRNIGTELAVTEWVAYVDGGTQPASDMLEAFLAATSDAADLDALYGFYHPLLTTRVARWFAIIVLPGARALDGRLMRNHSTACSMVRKSAWQRAGGFPPYRAAEDRIFMHRINRDGRFAEVPGATLTWIGPQTWRQVWRRTLILGEHSARAGRAGDWHWPTLRLWGLGAGLLLLLPWAFGASLLVAAGLARAWRRCRRHRLEETLGSHLWLDVPAVAALLVVMDLAMFLGWMRAIFTQDPGAANVVA